MQLCLYLTPELIKTPLEAKTKDAVIRELVSALAMEKKLSNADNLFKAVMEREETSSTFLPSGIAIPHARVPDVQDISVVMGVSNEPIDDTNGHSGLTARIFCLFFSPTMDKEFGRHLKLLARISALFCDTDFIDQVVAQKDSKAIFELLQKRERTLDEE